MITDQDRRLTLTKEGRWGVTGVFALIIFALAAPVLTTHPPDQQLDPVG